MSTLSSFVRNDGEHVTILYIFTSLYIRSIHCLLVSVAHWLAIHKFIIVEIHNIIYSNAETIHNLEAIPEVIFLEE